jgi:hypothetical protein
MGETVNISKMAESLSESLFTVFGWEKRSLANHQWDCVEPEKHHKKRGNKKHPTDAVFRYIDAYSGHSIYVNIDLKAYAASTLETYDFTADLKSLGHATECANKSAEWQQLFVVSEEACTVIGLLFVFNHDNASKRDFTHRLSTLAPSTVGLDPVYHIGVLIPSRVLYLNSVAADIKSFNNLPQALRFFYSPHLNKKKAVNVYSKSASLWSLMSSIVTVGCDAHVANPRKAFNVYYDGKGSSREEFQYVLDYLCRYAIVSETSDVNICLYKPDSAASAHFDNAKEEFSRDNWREIEQKSREEFNKMLENVKLRIIQQVIPQYEMISTGMDD